MQAESTPQPRRRSRRDPIPERPVRERAVIYGRESPTNVVAAAKAAGRDTPFDTQFAECRAYCEQRGYQIVGDPMWEVHSRAELWERDVLTEVRGMIRRHEVEVVVVHAVERLATGHHLGLLISEAEFHGVRYEFVVDKIEPGTIEGEVMLAARGISAVIERERTRERTQRGRKTRLGAKRPLPGPRARYGLRWVTRTADDGQVIKERYDEHPVYGKVVRRLFARALERATLRGQVAELHRDGIPSPTGKEWWRPGVISGILGDPIYTGDAAAFRWQAVTVKERGRPQYKTQRRRPKEEHHALPEGTAPAMIDPEDFDAVQRLLAHNKARSPRNAKYPDASPLKGYAFCAHCGQQLYLHADPRVGNHANGRRRTLPEAERPPDWRPAFVFQCRSVRYQPAAQRDPEARRCVPGIGARTLEEEVWEQLLAKLREPEYQQSAEREAAVDDGGPAVDLTAIDYRLKDVGTKIALRERQLAALDPEALPTVFADVTEKLEALYAERAANERERADRTEALRLAAAQKESWQRTREEWLSRLEAVRREERGDFFFALGVRVAVWPADPARRPEGARRWTAEGGLPEAGAPRFRLQAGGDAAVSSTRARTGHSGTAEEPAVFPLRWSAVA